MNDLTEVSVDSTDLRRLSRQWLCTPVVHREGLPTKMKVDGESVAVDSSWPDVFADSESARVQWEMWDFLSKGKLPPLKSIWDRNVATEIRESLTEPDFELAVVGKLHWEWARSLNYGAPSFGDAHFPHGWACAFKGAGHDRLVSRRWLEYGPWHLIRNEEHDVSFVQFHDLEADPQTALAQARPGHQRMGISDTGGFIQKRYVYEHDLEGFYLDDAQVLEIVVAGRTVSQCEMLDACAMRHYQALASKRPLRNVRFVFIEGEDAARAHLHELWLRELECWAIVAGDKVRLDDTYQPPPPDKPDWVRRLEASG